MKTRKIIIMTVLSLLLGKAYAQDTKSQFNPVEHAVISQTIAPDARSAGMGDVGAATISIWHMLQDITASATMLQSVAHYVTSLWVR